MQRRTPLNRTFWYHVGYRRGYEDRMGVVGSYDFPDAEGLKWAEEGYRDGQLGRWRETPGPAISTRADPSPSEGDLP